MNRPSISRPALTVLLAVLCACTTAPEPIGFSDAHNSVLNRLYEGDGPAALAEPGHPVHMRAIKASQTRLMVFSLGIARFSLEARESDTFEGVLAFLRDFRHHADTRFSHQLGFWGATDTTAPTRWVFSLEGAHLLGAAGPKELAALHEAGVRIVAIAHSFHGPFLAPGPSSSGAPPGPTRLADDSVLTPDGEQLVVALQESGFMLDVSHLREQAFWQVLALHQGPVPLIASHSGYRPLCDVDRNLNDEQIKAVVATGGLVAVPFHATVLSCGPEATVDDVAAHIVAMVEIVGPRGVAVGSDWEGRIKAAKGLERLEEVHNLTKALAERGLSRADIADIMGGNLWRVLGQLPR